MISSILSGDDDLRAMQELIHRLASRSTVIDFDEQMYLSTVRAVTRLWRDGTHLVGFAYVDDFNNLWFDTERDFALLADVESEIIQWGVSIVRRRNQERGRRDALDCSCDPNDRHRLDLLQGHQFVPQSVRSLHYSRSLGEPIAPAALPAGFSIRPVRGPQELEQLVALHRAAFQTSAMTVEQRLAMMSAPHYLRELDLVAVAPDGALAAFCVCGFLDSSRQVGHTDPIGTHPRFQRLGIARAIVTEGMLRMKAMGVRTAQLGTSSENAAMQELAGVLGFVLLSEKLWLSKAVSEM